MASSTGPARVRANPIDALSGMQLELDVPDGVAARASSTVLVDRAADYLRAGPASSQALVSQVCQLSTLPQAIAEHMAVTLLREHGRFVRTADGAWRLSEPPVYMPPAEQSPAAPHETEFTSAKPTWLSVAMPGTLTAPPQLPFVSLTTNGW